MTVELISVSHTQPYQQGLQGELSVVVFGFKKDNVSKSFIGNAKSFSEHMTHTIMLSI